MENPNATVIPDSPSQTNLDKIILDKIATFKIGLLFGAFIGFAIGIIIGVVLVFVVI